MKKKIFFLMIIVLLFPTLARMQETVPIKKKQIALTFDADMTKGMLKRLETGSDKSIYDARIINILRQEHVAATLFITGLWAEKYSSVVKDIASDSLFEIGNHSYSHRGFTKTCYKLVPIPEKEKENDLQKAQDILDKLSGQKPTLFRFPGGCANPSDIKLAEHLNLQVINWTLASGDAFNYNTASIVNNVLKNAKDGSVIVFHLSGGRYAPKTADALKIIIPELKKRGYEFVTVSNLGK